MQASEADDEQSDESDGNSNPADLNGVLELKVKAYADASEAMTPDSIDHFNDLISNPGEGPNYHATINVCAEEKTFLFDPHKLTMIFNDDRLAFARLSNAEDIPGKSALFRDSCRRVEVVFVALQVPAPKCVQYADLEAKLPVAAQVCATSPDNEDDK